MRYLKCTSTHLKVLVLINFNYCLRIIPAFYATSEVMAVVFKFDEFVEKFKNPDDFN